MEVAEAISAYRSPAEIAERTNSVDEDSPPTAWTSTDRAATQSGPGRSRSQWPFLVAPRKRMRSGDRPGLQNRRAAGNPVTGGFDPHSLPPIFQQLNAPLPWMATRPSKTCWSLARPCQGVALTGHSPFPRPAVFSFLSSTWGRADQQTSHDSNRVWGVLFCSPVFRFPSAPKGLSARRKSVKITSWATLHPPGMKLPSASARRRCRSFFSSVFCWS